MTQRKRCVVIRHALLKVFRQKMSITEWIGMWGATTLHDVFPLKSCIFYKKLALYFMSKVDFNREQKSCVPVERGDKSQKHLKMSKKTISHIEGCFFWNKFLINGIEERRGIKDRDVVSALEREIRECKHKSLLYLLSWTLRLVFACSSSMWSKSRYGDNVGLFNLSYVLYYLHAYKDKKIFDVFLKYAPTALCQETISFASLLRTMSDSKYVVRMIPWFGKISEMELVLLWSKGVHPVNVMLHDMEYADNLPMSGPISWIHDWIHTANYVCSNSIIFSTIIMPDVDKLSSLMSLYWNTWVKFLRVVVKMEMTDREQHMLFYLVHETFGSAIEKCRQILDVDFKIVVLKSNGYEEANLASGSQYLNKPLTIVEATEFAKKLRVLLMDIFVSDPGVPGVPGDYIVLNRAVPMQFGMTEHPKKYQFSDNPSDTVCVMLSLICSASVGTDKLFGILIPRHKPVGHIDKTLNISAYQGLIPYNKDNVSFFRTRTGNRELWLF